MPEFASRGTHCQPASAAGNVRHAVSSGVSQMGLPADRAPDIAGVGRSQFCEAARFVTSRDDLFRVMRGWSGCLRGRVPLFLYLENAQRRDGQGNGGAVQRERRLPGPGRLPRQRNAAHS